MASCEESYGFLPCSTSLGGSISTLFIYGFCLLQGANLLSEGSEMLLEVLDPGLIGGLLLPVLGALPDSLIIVVSGMGGTLAEAQEQVAVGIGTLAGSTIMLLTVAWGGSVLLGRCDLVQGRAVNKTLTRPFNLARTGVTTDSFTPTNAAIMSFSSLLYLLIQVPASLYGPSEPLAALVGAIVCLGCLAAYCAYQVLNPELQRRKMARAHQRRLHTAALKRLAHSAAPFGALLVEGALDPVVADQLFDQFDDNKSGTIDAVELKGLLVGLSMNAAGKEIPVPELDADVRYLLSHFDSNTNGEICRSEFHSALMRLITDRAKEIEQAAAPGAAAPATSSGLSDHLLLDLPGDHEPLLPETDAQAGDEKSEGSTDGEDTPLSTGQIVRQASLKLLLGTLACAFFSDPMVAAVTNFSKASGIPTFFVAFCVTPLASNASELVSSLTFASRKHVKNISLTFSQVYGAVTMNNTLCLGLFLLVVHARGLQWKFTSEVIVITGVTLLMGALGYSRTTFRTFWALPNLLLFPLSVLAIWSLDHFGHLH